MNRVDRAVRVPLTHPTAVRVTVPELARSNSGPVSGRLIAVSVPSITTGLLIAMVDGGIPRLPPLTWITLRVAVTCWSA